MPRDGIVNAAVAPNRQHSMNVRRMVSSFALHAAIATMRAKSVGITYRTGKCQESKNGTATSSSKKLFIPALSAPALLHLVSDPKAKASMRIAVSPTKIFA